MELGTLVDRPGYRWQTLPEPALVQVTIANSGSERASEIELRVACSKGMRHVRELEPAANRGPDVVLSVPDLAPGQLTSIILEFVSLPSTKIGKRSIGTLTLRWRQGGSIHQIGTIVSAHVLATGSAQQLRHPKITQALAARRGSSTSESARGTMSRT